MSIILGIDERGKPCAARQCNLLLLISFLDVLKDSFQGKRFTYRIDPSAQVPEDSLKLWRSRGFEPSSVGTAYVTFEATPGQEYTYPAYFWSE